MNDTDSPYPGQRFPCEIASHATWLYYRFGLRLRHVEDLLAERGVSFAKIIQSLLFNNLQPPALTNSLLPDASQQGKIRQ